MNKKDKEEKQNQSQEESREEDIIFEKEDLEVADLIKKLREKLKECESLKQDYLNGWQRAKADFANFNRKVEEEKQEFLRFATKDIIIQLIPVLDSFELAFRKEFLEESLKTWKNGMENIYGQLKAVILRNGVEEIRPEVGATFNPAEHEVISSQATAEEREIITELVQKGYKLNGKIIRAAQVRVGGADRN
jgi:molecular chaperone GrpE